MSGTSILADVEQENDRGPSGGRTNRSLELRLWDSDHEVYALVSFVRDGSHGGLMFSVDSEAYSAQVGSKTCVIPRGESQEFGITILTGSYANESAGGSMLIVINCGHEPPTLQVAARPVSGTVRAWSWEITHDIQHQILNLFADSRFTLSW